MQPITSEDTSQRELTLYKKLMISTEFILQLDLEEQYVDFLKNLMHDPEWFDFEQEIDSTINEFEITHEEIQATMKEMFIV